MPVKMVKPVPCAHIADYYDYQQLQHQSIGNNILRQGYREWSEGRIRQPMNNLYGKRFRSNPPRSVKQILVRQYNFRMGNLKRLEANLQALHTDLRNTCEQAVYTQMEREKVLHENRLFALEHNMQSFIEKSQTIQMAIHQLAYGRP